MSSTQLVEILGLELHLLSGCVQVRAVQLSSPVFPALRILSEEMCGKRASAIVFDRIVRKPRVEPIKAKLLESDPFLSKKYKNGRLAMQLLCLGRETLD